MSHAPCTYIVGGQYPAEGPEPLSLATIPLITGTYFFRPSYPGSYMYVDLHILLPVKCLDFYFPNGYSARPCVPLAERIVAAHC